MLLEGKQEQRGRQKELHGEHLRVGGEGGEGEKRSEIDVRLEERKDREDEWVGWWG